MVPQRTREVVEVGHEPLTSQVLCTMHVAWCRWLCHTRLWLESVGASLLRQHRVWRNSGGWLVNIPLWREVNNWRREGELVQV